MRRFFSFLVLTLAFLAVAGQTAQASPLLQAPGTATVIAPTMYLTPTPLADGSIYYIVLAGDTLYSISARTGVSIDTLERLNNIRRTDVLPADKRLLIGKGTPSTAEPTLAFVPTETPTPLPVSGTGTMCVQVFNDTNGNATRQEDEVLVGSAQISVALQNGTEVGSYTTDGVNEPHCFANLPAGEYNVSAAAPKGFNPTSDSTLLLKLQPGDKAYVSFGVQGHVVPTSGPSGGGGGASPLVGVAGLALIVSAGLMLYAVLRPRPKYRLR